MKKKILIIIVLFAVFPFFQIANGQNTWFQKANLGGGVREGAVGFSIGTKGYIGTGFNGSNLKDFWEWDQSTNVWTQKADFGGGWREDAIGFSIGTKGYIGLGDSTVNNGPCSDFWEWNQSSNIWTQKANFPYIPVEHAIGFSIGTKGYLGTGWYGSNSFTNEFWEWNQATNIWVQKANFGGVARWGSIGFSIGNKGYIGTGNNDSWWNDFWEWDQTTNTWTQKANFPGTTRFVAVGFSIGNYGYIGTGYDGTDRKDFWEWNQATNIWTMRTDFEGNARQEAVGFSIGNKGYIGTGCNESNTFYNDFWEYTPLCTAATPIISTFSQTIFCSGDSITLTSSSDSLYLWNNGNTNQSITINTSGDYSVSIIDSLGCRASSTITTVTVNPIYLQNVHTFICQGNIYTFPDSSVLTATSDTIQTSHLTTINSCDSIIVTSLSVNPTSSQNISATICQGNTYTFPDGTMATSDTMQTSHLITTNLCDSNIVTTLIVNPTYSQNISDSICKGSLYIFPDGSMSVIVLDTIQTSYLTSINSCDSTITTDLTVNLVDTSITVSVPILASNATVATYQWLDCNLMNTISGATNQSYTALSNGSYAVIVTQNGCTDTSSCYDVFSVGIGITSLKNYEATTYPNPNNGSFNLIYHLKSKSDFMIKDIAGRIVFSKSISGFDGSENITASNLCNGIYFWEILSSDGILAHGKIAVEK